MSHDKEPPSPYLHSHVIQSLNTEGNWENITQWFRDFKRHQSIRVITEQQTDFY